MYKKITHTIVEEHFAHPVGVDIATHLHTGTPVKVVKRIPTLADVMPESQFRSLIDNYFVDFESNLIHLADATFDPTMDFQKAIGDAMNVDALSSLLSKYYDTEFRERLSVILHNLALSAMGIWRGYSRNFDTTENVNRARSGIKYTGFLFNQYNNNWDYVAISEAFNNIITEIVKLGTAKKAKNVTNEIAAKDAIAALCSELATIIASGVVKQHPDFFTA